MPDYILHLGLPPNWNSKVTFSDFKVHDPEDMAKGPQGRMLIAFLNALGHAPKAHEIVAWCICHDVVIGWCKERVYFPYDPQPGGYEFVILPDHTLERNPDSSTEVELVRHYG